MSSAGPLRVTKSTAHASAAPSALYDLLGRFVALGSSIQNFDVVHAVQTALINPVHTVIQTVGRAVDAMLGRIGQLVGGVLFVVALPIEIPLGIYFFYSILTSGLWF
ncbi:hypothetical protein [Mycobacterium sp. RTGN5]|uniref:hypothetical protein n=1 Tax=Mycobacterium sp. RTGN5 TaxID=3016522 RepID=UPI0029C7C435|nr:hypothetical protein [Mycobacterium sp. RTGN5]